MLIRPETPADFATVADINLQAFHNRSEEAVIVALLRQRPSYTPEFSLVAEEKGRVLGHALFSPCQVVYAGALRRMIILAPLAVHPDAQKQGIGGTLIREGHRLAQEKGFDAAMLLGHPTYYPRFGYQTHVFGMSALALTRSDLPENQLETRPVLPTDIPELMALWDTEEGAVNFAMRPDAHFVDWLSPNPNMKIEVYLRDSEIVGYSRSKETDVRVFLAKNPEAARMMARHLAGESETIVLPLHPASASAKAFTEAPTVQAWDAGMACFFNTDLPKDSVAGRPIWFSAFELA
jgi:putative acetyltransferase